MSAHAQPRRAADGLPTPGYSLTLRVELVNQPGALGRLTTAIGKAGGDIGAVDIVHVTRGLIVRDITVNTSSPAHGEAVVKAAREVEGVEVVHVSDPTFLMHLGGKIEITPRTALKTRSDLSMAYTPGVARVCMAIHEDRERAFTLTIKKNSVAIVSDGTAVLGLGNIGPYAAMPVMEGKAMLFKQFGGVDAFPICLATTDTDDIVQIIKGIAPAFGGINLEDISAPRCFEVEERLRHELDIPVFHDDQHGTAVVVLAGLLNALKIVGKPLSAIRVVVNGMGAAGVACASVLMAAGVRHITGCDRPGIVYVSSGEPALPFKALYEATRGARHALGTLQDALAGADVFVGLSGPHVLEPEDLDRMAQDAIVFAMANPVPEIMPERATARVAIMATGRSDYPNQINNVLCFPGLFRGALDCRASAVTEEMKLAAAYAIAGVIGAEELDREYIIPSVFDRRVADAVAQAVVDAAYQSGVARRERLRQATSGDASPLRPPSSSS